MIRVLSGAAAALFLGALTAFAARAPQSDPNLKCEGCVSGIANWHPVFTMTDDNGNLCYVTATIWRRDGSCKLVQVEEELYKCVPRMFCEFWMQTWCSCGTACQNIILSMYNVDGTLVFSMPSQGAYIFGMPCGSQQWVSIGVHNVLTGESMSQLNGFACSKCELVDPAPPDGG